MTTETKAQHTPGPWVVAGSWEPDDMHPTYVMSQADYLVIADIVRQRAQPEGDAEVLANARLIAACPELLEALKACVANDVWEGGLKERAAAIIAKEETRDGRGAYMISQFLYVRNKHRPARRLPDEGAV